MHRFQYPRYLLFESIALSLLFSIFVTAGFSMEKTAVLPEEKIVSDNSMVSVGTLFPPPLHEVSGMDFSLRFSDFVWVHNDSGGAPRLLGFPIPNQSEPNWGKEYRQVFLDGERNLDWEDLMMGSDGRLYIADTGNNLKLRETLTLLRISEPKALPYAQSSSAERILFRYESPDGIERYARRDCEAICQFGDGILLFTKRLLTANCDVFYLANVVGNEVGSEVRTAEFLFRITNFRGVTSADSWQDHGKTRFAVLSYGLIWIWEMESGDLSSNLLQRIVAGRGFKIWAGLCETLTFEKRDCLIITNEGRDVFRLDIGMGNIQN